MESIEIELKKITAKVDKMYFALLGNELTRDGGLVGRINKLEEVTNKLDEDIEALTKKNLVMQVYQRIMWAAIGGTVGLVFSYVVQLFFTSK